MRYFTVTFVGAALIAAATNQVAFSKELHQFHCAPQCVSERFRNANAFAHPLPPQTTGHVGRFRGWESIGGVTDNDTNVYRDGQHVEYYEINPHGG
jgi:hypothetical protein